MTAIKLKFQTVAMNFLLIKRSKAFVILLFFLKKEFLNDQSTPLHHFQLIRQIVFLSAIIRSIEISAIMLLSVECEY